MTADELAPKIDVLANELRNVRQSVDALAQSLVAQGTFHQTLGFTLNRMSQLPEKIDALATRVAQLAQPAAAPPAEAAPTLAPYGDAGQQKPGPQNDDNTPRGEADAR